MSSTTRVTSIRPASSSRCGTASCWRPQTPALDQINWCISDGSAAERFAGDFTHSYGLDGVSEDVLHEVTRRTPGFHAWQDPHWLVHCQDAAAFVGEVGYAELAAHPEALDRLRTDMRLDGRHDESRLEHFLTGLGEGATAMLFRCTGCGVHLAYTDAS
ncbi:CbrC family protein [Streptomyces sp. NPDC096046]|uniref:CbrC family protein n=1 Tax=Streptomyces sp. NPDC096046 TaxID=3155542 RepID=UPI003328F8FE